jgi:Flp pilus assembly pilin Flp
MSVDVMVLVALVTRVLVALGSTTMVGGMMEVLSLESVPVSGQTEAAAVVVQMSVEVMVLVALVTRVLVALGSTTMVGGMMEVLSLESVPVNGQTEAAAVVVQMSVEVMVLVALVTRVLVALGSTTMVGGMMEVLSLESVPVSGQTEAAAVVVQMSVEVMVLVALVTRVLVALGSTTMVGGIRLTGSFNVEQSTDTEPQFPEAPTFAGTTTPSIPPRANNRTNKEAALFTLMNFLLRSTAIGCHF